MVKDVSSDVMEIVEPAKEGYQLTLSINFDKIPRGKGLVILHFNDIQKILGTWNIFFILFTS